MAEYTCDECGSAFTTMEAVARHYKHDHPKVAKRYLKMPYAETKAIKSCQDYVGRLEDVR